MSIQRWLPVKKSRIIVLSRPASFIRRAWRAFGDDRVAVYSAQASFFIIISSIPFIMLLISIGQYIIPGASEHIISAVRAALPYEISMMIDWDSESGGGFTLLSLSAVAAYWSASRGVGAVFRGVEGVYGSKAAATLIRRTVRNLLYTLAFIAAILSSVILLVFGSAIRDITADNLPALSAVTARILQNQGIFFFAFLTVFFRFIYAAAAKETAYEAHLLGASLAAVGWMIFSYSYSLYLRHFSEARSIYGGLTSVVLLMLWIYFCMMILLFGAEINKLISKADKR
jgi:membrane protein